MKNRRKTAGVTIAEMCVVLAVLAIVGTLVVSFSAMVSARSAAATTKLRAAEDLELSRVILESWVDRMTALDASITADETGLSATVGGQTYRVVLEENSLIAPLPDGQQLFCPIEAAKELRFWQITRPNGNPLIYCMLTYTVVNPVGAKTVMTNIFTVLSRVGETVGESTEETGGESTEETTDESTEETTTE